jgi:large subunit ribosomal protein L32e
MMAEKEAEKSTGRSQKKEETEVKEVTAKKAGKKKAEGKIKPQLDKDTENMLEIRKDRYSRQPSFRRGEWFRYKRVGTNWRRPRGVSSKIRLNRKYRPPKVRIGYGKPSAVRDFHPSGFREVMVFNAGDLEDIDPRYQAARIGSTVGTRKRRDIVQAADEKGIRVLNRGVL